MGEGYSAVDRDQKCIQISDWKTRMEEIICQAGVDMRIILKSILKR